MGQNAGFAEIGEVLQANITCSWRPDYGPFSSDRAALFGAVHEVASGSRDQEDWMALVQVHDLNDGRPQNDDEKTGQKE